jgi:hypothetical protein
MKGTSVSTAFRNYIDGLGGPHDATDNEPEFDVQIPSSPETAQGVARELALFVSDLKSATNHRFSGWFRIAHSVGARDGAFAIPGQSGTDAEDATFTRPPFVNKMIEFGGSAVHEAEVIAELYRSGLELSAGVSGTSAESNQSRRRRNLHGFQLGLLIGAAILAVAAFGALAVRLNEWPSTAHPLSGGSGFPTSTSLGYLTVSTFLIAALGVTAGFFAANRERSFAKVHLPALDAGEAFQGGRQSEDSEADADLPTGLSTTEQSAFDELSTPGRIASDQFVTHLWSIGTALSVAVGFLIAVGGYFKLESVSLSRMSLGAIAWSLWGGVFFLFAAYLVRISQHWLNMLPAEIDLTEYDHTTALQNQESAKLGLRYVNRIVDSHRLFVVDACSTIIDHYYEINLRSRNNSRNISLDRFAIEDGKSARQELDAATRRTDEPDEAQL